jgi:type I restriction-modification system DNA methylase subunit
MTSAQEGLTNFYNNYKDIRQQLVENIRGLPTEEDRLYYAQIFLNRLIFIYFIQKRGFLEGDTNYLSNHFNLKDLETFGSFFSRLCFEGLALERDKPAEFQSIPYLNAELFHKHPMELDYEIVIPDPILKSLLSFLDRWEWIADENLESLKENQITPTILGYIFEKSINQKETGAVYTPADITRYLCKQSLLSYLRGWFRRKGEPFTSLKAIFKEKVHVKEVYQALRNIKICDNACGSGAFIIAAQEYLLALYKEIIENMRTNGQLEQLSPENLSFGGRLLDFTESITPVDEYFIKTEIILRNLYGVDIDAEAIEICRLRLWLSLISHFEAVRDLQPLPNIEYNFICGNSLIGYSKVIDPNQLDGFFNRSALLRKINSLAALKEQYRLEYQQHKLKTLKKEIANERIQIKKELDGLLFQYFKSRIGSRKYVEELTENFNATKPFHWGMEFPEVFQTRGGFDIIIGNPPYINTREISKLHHGALWKVLWKLKPYYSAYRGYDLSILFIERAHELLARENGTLGYIITNKFLVTDYGLKIRQYILKHFRILEIIDLSKFKVFKDMGVYPVIISLSTFDKDEPVNLVTGLESYTQFKNHAFRGTPIPKSFFSTLPRNIFAIYLSQQNLPIVQKMLEGSVFLNSKNIQCGITGFNYTKIGQHITDIVPKMKHWKFVVSGNITQFKIKWGIDVQYFSKKWEHPYLIATNEISNGKKLLYSTTPKVLIRGIATRLTAGVDNIGLSLGTSVYAIIDRNFDPYYLSGLLNSDLLNFFYNTLFESKHLQGNFIAYNEGQLISLPIKPFQPQNPLHQRIFEIAQILETKEDESLLQELNSLVFKLYDIERCYHALILGH